jgi:hypothetical protein
LRVTSSSWGCLPNTSPCQVQSQKLAGVPFVLPHQVSFALILQVQEVQIFFKPQWCLASANLIWFGAWFWLSQPVKSKIRQKILRVITLILLQCGFNTANQLISCAREMQFHYEFSPFRRAGKVAGPQSAAMCCTRAQDGALSSSLPLDMRQITYLRRTSMNEAIGPMVARTSTQCG